MDNTILETIENLRQSGLGEDEIKSMLLDIGFDNDMINEALGQKSNNKEEPKQVTEQKKDNLDFISKTKDHAEEAKLASNLSMNIANATANKVDQHIEKVNKIEDRLDNFENALNNIPKKEHLDEIKEMHSNLHEKHDDLSERIDSIEAKIDGLTKIMKDILENQRDILMRLK